MDDPRITVAGDGIHVAGNPRTELLEAATAALRWFDLFDQHAPSDMIFGGEAEVRGLLRDATRRARVEAEDRTWADAANPDEAAALDEERTRLGLRGRGPHGGRPFGYNRPAGVAVALVAVHSLPADASLGEKLLGLLQTLRALLTESAEFVDDENLITKLSVLAHVDEGLAAH